MTSEGDLRHIFRLHFPEAQWTAFESPMTAAGIPDHEYCFPQGKSGWIEYKKTHTRGISNLKPLQIAWLERRGRLGGRAFVAVRRMAKNDDQLWLIHAAKIREVMDLGLSPTDGISVWAGGPSRWPWDRVKKI